MPDPAERSLIRQRFNLRMLPILVAGGFLLTVWNVYEVPEPTVLDVAAVLFGGLMLGAAFGLLFWKAWARWVLLLGVGINFLLVLGVGLLVIQSGHAPWLLGVPLLLNLYILSILLHPRTQDILRVAGRLSELSGGE